MCGPRIPSPPIGVDGGRDSTCRFTGPRPCSSSLRLRIISERGQLAGSGGREERVEGRPPLLRAARAVVDEFGSLPPSRRSVPAQGIELGLDVLVGGGDSGVDAWL